VSEQHTPGPRYHRDVSCPRCRERYPHASDYEVGNVARPSMGHQMYFTNEGRIALCIAKHKEREMEAKYQSMKRRSLDGTPREFIVDVTLTCPLEEYRCTFDTEQVTSMSEAAERAIEEWGLLNTCPHCRPDSRVHVKELQYDPDHIRSGCGLVDASGTLYGVTDSVELRIGEEGISGW